MQQIAIVLACLVGVASASYLPAAAPALAVPAAPVLHAPSFTTSAHVGNVQSVSRSYSTLPQTRFQRTDWNQPGSLITQEVFAPVVAPTYGQVAVRGPDRLDSYLVPRPPLVQNFESHLAGVAHVPAAIPVPAAVPVPVAAPAYAPAPLPVAAPIAAPAYAPAPIAVKGY